MYIVHMPLVTLWPTSLVAMLLSISRALYGSEPLDSHSALLCHRENSKPLLPSDLQVGGCCPLATVASETCHLHGYQRAQSCDQCLLALACGGEMHLVSPCLGAFPA